MASSFPFYYRLLWVPGLSTFARQACGARSAQWQEKGTQVTQSHCDGINLKDHRQPQMDCDLGDTFEVLSAEVEILYLYFLARRL